MPWLCQRLAGEELLSHEGGDRLLAIPNRILLVLLLAVIAPPPVLGFDPVCLARLYRHPHTAEGALPARECAVVVDHAAGIDVKIAASGCQGAT